MNESAGELVDKEVRLNEANVKLGEATGRLAEVSR